jgi:hypothetical protein
MAAGFRFKIRGRMSQKARVVTVVLSMLAAAAGLSQFSPRVRRVDILAIFAAGALAGSTLTSLIVSFKAARGSRQP